MKDKIFNKEIEKQFEFDDEVANVFDDMIDRSVPFYKENLSLSINILNNYLKEGDKVLDLGFSTGNFLISLAKLNKTLNLKGLDNSPAMVQKAKQKAKAFGINNIEFIEADFLNYPFDKNRVYLKMPFQVLQF